jgi:hypothetical protein
MDSSKPPSKAPIEPALRALVVRARRELGPHASADELVAYHLRRLSEADAERLRDHLALCAECAGLLLDLAAFSEQAPAVPSEPTTEEVEAAWRDLAPRLGAAVARVDPPPRRRHAPVFPSSLPLSLAAALLAGVIALSSWVVALRREVRAHSRPRADAVLANLEPAGEGTRGDDGAARQPRIQADRPATLIFHSPPARDYPSYELQVSEIRPGGRLAWQATGLHPQDLGIFVLDLPAGALPPGKYLVRLYGLMGERREALADYQFEIARP